MLLLRCLVFVINKKTINNMIFEMRRILFLQKNPQKKNFSPPQQAVVARFARASLTATERRGGQFCEIIKNGNLILSLAPYAPRTVQNQYVFQKQGLMQRRVILKKTTKFLQLWSSCIFWLKNARVSKDIANSIFLRSKKININGAAGEKKLGYGVKMLPFTQNHSTNPFFE